MPIIKSKITQSTETTVIISYEEFCEKFNLPKHANIKLIIPGSPASYPSEWHVDITSKFVADWTEKKNIEDVT
jgi:hypothetical protein